ncbi:MAG: hypothetical protein JST22_12720 [Bacteroidetes bacterium]|nr:hypothetical protein [Bacteroidota bacterium]
MLPQIRFYVGKGTPSAMSRQLTTAVESVEITHNDTGASGIQITFQTGRQGAQDVKDDPIVSDSSLKVFNRVVIQTVASTGGTVLFDGIITHHEYAPSNTPGQSRLTVTGEDASVMMDLEEKTKEHPNQHEGTIATKIIGDYSQYGLTPKVKNPPTIIVPSAQERVPVQHETDLQYLRRMAARYNYHFYINPGDTLFSPQAYWGPPVRSGNPQRALSLDLGRFTNVAWITFQYNGLAPTKVADRVQERTSDKQAPAKQESTTLDTLSKEPGLTSQGSNVRKSFLRAPWGLDNAQTRAQAQAMVDNSVESVVTASGELDVAAYGDVLKARDLVDLRGVGGSYNGTWYVSSVTHSIRNGSHIQRFTLSREGIGGLKEVVRV